MKRYSLKVEKLSKDCTESDVRDLFDGPSPAILEKIEIIRNDLTATALLIFTRQDVIYEYLNSEELGKRVTLLPELIDEMSITLNGSWLRELEDENPLIKLEIKKMAEEFNLVLQESNATISLMGVPWQMEQAKVNLDRKLQEMIIDRSRKVQIGLNKNPVKPEGTGLPYAGNTTAYHSMDNAQSSVDIALDVNKKGSSELDNPQSSKRRQRVLKTDETNCETSDNVASIQKNDAETIQPKEAKRKRVLVGPSKPEETQKPDSSADELAKSPTVWYTASTQYQAVVSVNSDTEKYLLEHPNRLGLTDCSVTQVPVSEDHIDWVIGNNNQKDLRRNEDGLKRLIDKLHTECYVAPDEFDFDIFKDFIESNNKNEDITLVFNPKIRSCKVIALKDEVKDTYQWLVKISDEFLTRNERKPVRGFSPDKNDDTKSNDKERRDAHQLDTPQSESHWNSKDQNSDISAAGNKQSRFPYPKKNVKKSGDRIFVSKSSKDRLELTTRGNLRVSVYHGNMIKQATEVIVNPANEHLAHGGGLARVILSAGGPVIDQESREIISKHGKVQTSEVVHTSAGNLPSPIKYVIHAVGPTAHEFKDNKAGLIPTLKVTFRNCLEYANDKLGVSSISLPPISSGIFAVPIPDIIQGVVEAIQDFDAMNPSAVLKEVHFISNDAATTEEMIKCFLNVIG